MKSNIKKKIFAIMLCMVMMLNVSASALADDTNIYNTDNAKAGEHVSPLTTVDTVDNDAVGVKMRMINFPNQQTDIGGGYSLNRGRTAGLLSSTVQANGYPRSKKGNVDFANWFDEAHASPVNHLFIKSIYDETGYLSYSSFDNYAWLDTESGNFTVYDQIGTPSLDPEREAYFYWRGNFMPYNKIEAGKFSRATNLYSPTGEALAKDSPRYGEKLYKTQGSNDYYFGMYVEANFAQAKGGVYNGSPMQFHFNGDDDLWVYIDGVLVLDIGGIHDAQSGYINFQTGQVFVKALANGTGTDTTIKSMFQEAGQDVSGFAGDTFADYSPHKIQIFYMERGAGASNLQMSFHLPIIPEGQIQVAKELSNTDKEKYANVEFGFQVYAQKITGTDETGNEAYSDEYVLITDNAVLSGTDQGIVFDENGIFYLKPGQKAIFSGLKQNRKYYVREVNVKTDEYDVIKVNGTVIDEFDENNHVTGSEISVESDRKTVSERPLVVFTNQCSAANSRELCITKKMEGLTIDTFDFRIFLENAEGELEPYVGEYYLKDANGNYYRYSDHLLVSNGTESVVCGSTDTEGTVSGVPVGCSVILTQILSGTAFYVEEINLDEIYDVPIKEVVDDTYKVSDIDGADGEILLGKNAEVIITNKYRSSVKVTKSWSRNPPEGTVVYAGLYRKTMGQQDSAQGTEDVYTAVEGKYITLNSENEWCSIFTPLESGEVYAVKELRPVLNGETAEFTIDGIGYIGLEENGTVTYGDNCYYVEYGNLIPDERIPGQKNMIITNHHKNDILQGLPNTGSLGIYWYMIGGVLFFITAALILYKNKFMQKRRADDE